MKIVYINRDAAKRRELIESKENFLALTKDNWDDYTYKTMFGTVCYISGEEVELGYLKILIEDQNPTFSFLDQLIDNGWNGVFPIPNTNYISNPESILFYEQLISHLDAQQTIHIAEKLRDASYLAKIAGDDIALELIKLPPFKISLLRERGAIKSFLDGWHIFVNETISIKNIEFNYSSPQGINNITLNYEKTNLLPRDINVLIGPNGSGKSRFLHQMVDDWLHPNREESLPISTENIARNENAVDGNAEKPLGFVERPNLSQLVVVSYSPFELFPVDTNHLSIVDKNIYRYFGFRGPAKNTRNANSKASTVTLSREHPKAYAARSLIDCISDDEKNSAIKDWSLKIETVENVLGQAFSFDYAGVQIGNDVDTSNLFRKTVRNSADYIIEGASPRTENEPARRYVKISSADIETIDPKELLKVLEPTGGVAFFKNDQEIHLSSGQRLFSYIVINILGAIRKNSLILVDEPELFLHPNLEIEFISMLKSILKSYASKALLATHSLVTVREVPADCVHVFESTRDGLFINHPPFETFGGDVQRISSYVFGDKSVTKPYLSWLKDKLHENNNDVELLLDKLGKNINEEMIIQLGALRNNDGN
jgi:ABC-type cobalamin/Fe3+-siderophores transport system ATPase subunit